MNTSTKLDYCNIPVVFDSRGDHGRGHAMRRWLFENLDPDCYDAEDFSIVSLGIHQRKIWFSNEKDALWFALRWN